ncbi:uncharacterized protein Tco025E_03361 [Trypanosoma conorhini]|uniref:Uncharacterized protein n=1 Tax=Trypanosoma conorhini TaxID=83891 RepID=A0A3R7L5K3_9TRYP|nr:uncharacterized protein Tco025E_03361 [Trypanosoma conorhini]RNF21512.1 hypothetical protein Tco025E_03361 [Trypanosoma conorhini]
MDRRDKREFGRNVTNAPVGKPPVAGPQGSDAAGRARRHPKRPERGEEDEAAARLAAAAGAKRRCTEERARCRPSPGPGTRESSAAVSPARCASGSASSVEACFFDDDDAVAPPSACGELLTAVEQSDAAVMAGLRSAGDAAPPLPPSAPPPSPAAVPMLF